MKKFALALLVVLLLIVGASARIRENPDQFYPTYPMSLQVRSLYLCPQQRSWHLGSNPARCSGDTPQTVFTGRTVRHTPNARQPRWYQEEMVNHYIVIPSERRK